MATRIENLKQLVENTLGDKLSSSVLELNELTIVVKSSVLVEVTTVLRDVEGFKFEQLIDLCGVDYSDYAEGAWDGLRYAVVYHLQSVSLNQRIRLRVFAADDEFPVLPTMVDIWPVANWFEREAFDMYGIMFEGHPDLRRLLTDYGFVGHPFRKDFPMVGNVEMRYDPAQQRVVYQPVSIELRNNVPRLIRDEGFHHG